MLPPVPDDALFANPLFKDLYETLTTKILNPEDLTTRSASRSHHVLDQVCYPLLFYTTELTNESPIKELRTHRAELAKSQLLQRELETITTWSSALPDEVCPAHPPAFTTSMTKIPVNFLRE